VQQHRCMVLVMQRPTQLFKRRAKSWQFICQCAPAGLSATLLASGPLVGGRHARWV
jgi:hypothetical protein